MAIIVFVGGIGTNKTLSMNREIVNRQQKCLTNFKLYNYKDYKRLMVKDLVKVTASRKNKKLKYKVNFEFWNNLIKKQKCFDIYIDELHNIANSRTGSHRMNIALNMWIAQVRKILQGNEQNNIYVSTQRPMSIDIGWRDLAHWWVVCERKILPATMMTEVYNGKKISLPISIATQKWFDNLEDCRMYMITGQGKPLRKVKFIANEYYKFYNTFELITFSNKYV